MFLYTQKLRKKVFETKSADIKRFLLEKTHKLMSPFITR